MRARSAATTALVLTAATVAVGLAAGLGGMTLALLLHFIQHVAYGYGLGPERAPSFLQGVTAASPARRVAAMAACGLVAGAGGWALRRFGRPLVGVPEAVRPGGAALPPAETVADALLQIVTVALGSPLGREVAPRQVGAVFAGWIARVAKVPPETRRLLVACGAGAGLAAVYNVPLGGAVYTLEVLLGAFSLPVAAAALGASVIAAQVAWIGLGNERFYFVVPFTIGPSLVTWSIVAGPILGAVAFAFSRLAALARSRAPRAERLVPWCFATFLALGFVATEYPQILGNGRGPAQLGFESQVAPSLAALLFALKFAASPAALRAGAHGGLLTPSLALGALLATVLGAAWSLAWPEAPAGAFAVVGAAAFLASSQKMPLTACVLGVEFTRVGHDALFPILFAVSGAAAVREGCARWERRRREVREKRAASPAAGTRASGCGP